MSFAELINIETLVQFLLILFRVAGLFISAPMLSNPSIPKMVRLGISLLIAFLLLPLFPFEAKEALTSDLFLFTLILEQVLIGLLLGFAASIAFAVIQAMGEIIGIKVGFGIARIIDPANQGSSSILSNFYILIGGLIFLYLNGHHIMISAMAESFRIIPIGSGVSFSFGGHLTELVGDLTSLAIKMAAPVIVVGTLLNIIFGFVTKLSPQMNIYFNVGFILGPAIGLAMMMISLPLFRVLLTQMTKGLNEDLMRILYELKGV